ncbi:MULTISPECIES: helix-turn-helix transcriptional regulator [unclassified Arthrobacter]|uniref:ArsR/SmtB family transcription factor n=1 Tax=unclassified Arthrobacter TaxID=235627 RepID=UPI00159D0B0E|nr:MULTISPECIES: metalloregulator ArsR/SmtB family transcription factor [unclassified Arthrobacter]MCQ9164301.1 metalloregulator ArsR/SmtB family transcription factor [Arthrobacter sp. STN4]NVM99480.1 helix-turn-helix transcriptional regulator [Arthrobacter sp. SDTb3-6]
MTTTSTAPVFAALGDPHRQQLLTLLARGGAASASSLAPSLPVSRQAVDRHLRILSSAGLVEPRRSGREVLYSVRRAELDRSAAWLRDLADGWDRRLSAIKAAAEAPE